MAEQPDGSVVFVSFGSRTALSRDQIREVGDGLVKSGCKFLWVVKEKLLDREEERGDLDEIVVGRELMEKIRGRGLVMKSWVGQGEILGYNAVGGFVIHSGWNSVAEAAWHGFRVLAWPQHGDQRVNAEVVEMSGIGIWPKNWVWSGDRERKLVKGHEIGEKIKELMRSEELRLRAARISEEAKKATGVGGCSEKMLKKLVDELKNARG